MNILILHDDAETLEYIWKSIDSSKHTAITLRNTQSLTHPKLMAILKKKDIHLFIFKNANVDTKLMHHIYPNLILVRIIDSSSKISNDYNVYHYINEPIDISILSNEISNCQFIFDLKIRNSRLVEDLKNSNELLKNKNEMLMRFAYITAHDLRTPIRSISGLANRISIEFDREPLDREKVKYILGMILDSTEKMKSLIDDSLNFSIVSKEHDRKMVDMNAVLESVLSEIRQAIPKNATILKPIRLPCVCGSEILLGRMLLNLIGNAIKFNDKESLTIEIGASQCDDMECIVVRDNGIGIDTKYHDKVFDLFERINTGYDGNGMGLAIVKEIVDRHYGYIELESELDKYTEFRIFLPKISVPCE